MKRIINVSFVAGVSALAFSLSASTMQAGTMQAGNDEEMGSKAVGKQVAGRQDVRRLPRPLKQRLVDMAKRPHSYLPLTAFSEAATPSQLFQSRTTRRSLRPASPSTRWLGTPWISG